MALLRAGIHGPLAEKQLLLDRLQAMAGNESFPVVMPESVMQTFHDICTMRQQFEQERQEDARNLKEVLYFMFAVICGCFPVLRMGGCVGGE